MVAPLIDRNTRGVFPIAVTPFLDNGAIDFVSLDRLTDFFIECGVPGVTFLGVLGEGAKLSAKESIDVLERVIHRLDGKAKVIAGASHIGFDNAKAFTAQAMDLGASGIMVSPAAGLKTEEQVLNFFHALIQKIGDDVPLALQDFPQNSGVFVSARTIGELLTRFSSIKIVKHEESPALRKITALRAQETSGQRERVSILVGNSGMHLPQELHRGVDGANTGVAFPEMLIEVCRRFFSGDSTGAEDLYDLFLPLIRHEQQPGIGLAIRKEIFRRRGLISSAKLRAPGPALDQHDHLELDRLLLRLTQKLRDREEEKVIASYHLR